MSKDFEEATAEYVAAIEANNKIRAETFQAEDEESKKKYDDAYARVQTAASRWHELFKPGG